jgi:protein-tyrosine phosphatase
VLTQLTEHDFAYLTPLQIRVVCDFRTERENATSPEIWIPNLAVEHVSLPIGSASNRKDAMAGWTDFLKTNPSPEQMKAHMTAAYGEFAFANASEYAKVFVELKQERLPLLYHCAGGKDRTGVFSALLLLTLGVPETTVLEDYELTDKYLLDAMSGDAVKKMITNTSSPSLAQLSPEQRRVMMAADPDYLRSTLHRINEKYGSFENYRRAALGVSDEDVRQLKARLLTD